MSLKAAVFRKEKKYYERGDRMHLNQTGLDIYFDEQSNHLYFGPEVAHTGFGSRYVKELAGLFHDASGAGMEPCYDFYRGISRFGDAALFEERRLRYDITVIMPGAVNGEYKKTSGHYHGPMGRQTTYPEVYEVLKGTAVFVLQKPVETVTEETRVAEVEDFRFIEVHEGESVVIPGGYGHCSINIGDGPLLFSNLAAVDCPLYYAPVKNMRGMAYYLNAENTPAHHEWPLTYTQNPAYDGSPAPCYARAVENISLGIVFGEPLYLRFMHEPDVFRYLTDYSSYSSAALTIISLSSDLS